uniref:SNARE associated Golgi protein n=1 Tax=Phytophthora ramorum TaxID=164328 RepID=H3H040_PHYRM
MAAVATRAGEGRALLLLATKLALIFGCAVGIVLGLCLLLVRRVREHDAALGLATSKLDSLSVRSLSSLEELQRSHETFQHVFTVQFPLALTCFTVFYILKQTFAIPGSALLNVFAGAFLPLTLAFPLSLASEEIVLSLSERVLPGKLHTLRLKIEDARERGQLPFLLLFLRVFPFTPNWFLNIASPWLQVPLKLFAPSVAFGLLPYNFVTVNAGAMLSTLRSTSDLLDLRTMGLLVVLAVGMLIPALLKKKGVEAKDEADEIDVDGQAESNSKKMD